MRVFQTLAASLMLPMAALAAGSDKFEELWSKQLTMNGPLKVDDQSYNAITTGSRNYTTAVLLTALDARFACALCHEFAPEWELLTKSWIKADKAGDNKVIFAVLDFLDGRTVFQSLGLQTAPNLYVFPPTQGPYAKSEGQYKKLDFNAGLNRADPVNQWLKGQIPGGPHPDIVRPTNWLRIIMGSVSALGALTLVVSLAPTILPFVQNRNLWAGISIISILLFTSGHMFNHIRKTPYVAGDGKGKVSYFAGGFGNQFGLETQIIAVIYGILAFATISIALKVPRMTDPTAQRTAVYLWGAVIFLTYSFLMSIFRFKNGGYPFSLPPF